MYDRNLFIAKVHLALIDLVTVYLAGLVALWLPHTDLWTGEGFRAPMGRYLVPFAVTAFMFVLVLRFNQMYNESRWEALGWPLFRACVVASMLVLALSFFFRGGEYSRATALLFIPMSFVCVHLGRRGFAVYQRSVRGSRRAVRRVAVVGTGELATRLMAALGERPLYYDVVGVITESSADDNATGLPVIGQLDDLEGLVDRYEIQELILAVRDIDHRDMVDLIGRCMMTGVGWRIIPDLFGLSVDRAHLDTVAGIPLLSVRGAVTVGFAWVAKRIVDTVAAAILLALAAPVMILVAAAVKVTSPGPVLYRQVRIGLGAEPFQMLKFRSMRPGESVQVHKDFTADWIYGRTEHVHKMTTDPRITGVGKVIRALSLDELPQLINVLRGEMSLVGPRPALPYEVDRYTEWHKQRFSVLPGITGLWQVSGRNDCSFDEMIEIDLRYIESWSVTEDVRIMLKTVPAMVTGGGR